MDTNELESAESLSCQFVPIRGLKNSSKQPRMNANERESAESLSCNLCPFAVEKLF
jgi:hypothetical protein